MQTSNVEGHVENIRYVMLSSNIPLNIHLPVDNFLRQPFGAGVSIYKEQSRHWGDIHDIPLENIT